MVITIAPELEIGLQKKAEADGISVEAYVERLIREDEDWGERAERVLSDTDPEFAEVRAAVREGLEQAERGEGRTAEEVFAELRARHGLSR
jgi:predicted transcriptional regulator